MLTGQAKKAYQRNYMRMRRAAVKTTPVRPTDVRPLVVRPMLDPVRPVKTQEAVKTLARPLAKPTHRGPVALPRPDLDADGNTIPEY